MDVNVYLKSMKVRSKDIALRVVFCTFLFVVGAEFAKMRSRIDNLEKKVKDSNAEE